MAANTVWLAPSKLNVVRRPKPPLAPAMRTHLVMDGTAWSVFWWLAGSCWRGGLDTTSVNEICRRAKTAKLGLIRLATSKTVLISIDTMKKPAFGDPWTQACRYRNSGNEVGDGFALAIHSLLVLTALASSIHAH